jgi:hypothetical protein
MPRSSSASSFYRAPLKASALVLALAPPPAPWPLKTATNVTPPALAAAT